MEQLIDRLIQIDKEARVRVSKAKKERVKALETVDEQRKALEREYQDKLNELIAVEQQQAEQAKTAALSEIEKSKQSLINGLDALYRTHEAEWVQQIVLRVKEG